MCRLFLLVISLEFFLNLMIHIFFSTLTMPSETEEEEEEFRRVLRAYCRVFNVTKHTVKLLYWVPIRVQIIFTGCQQDR